MRHQQAVKAAEILGVRRAMLTLQDHLIDETFRARLHVDELGIRPLW